MTLLEFHRVSKTYDGLPFLEDLSFKIEKGEKVGLVGGNGAGKSTLFKLIAGIEDVSGGTLALTKETAVGYLAQEAHFDAGRTLYDELLEVFAPLRRLEHELEQLALQLDDDERLMARYSQLQTEFERQGGYAFEHRIDAVLQGLGIQRFKDRKMATLSGGEKNIAALARQLLAEPDLLLLDEPANHLDFGGLEWLEGFVRGYNGTVVLVSHNRYLLDRTVNRIIEIEDGQATSYPGNYSAFRALKMKAMLEQQAAYEDQQKEIRRMEAMIRRFEQWARLSDDPRHARRAQNRRRMIERMDKVERPDLDRKGIAAEFGQAARAGHIALELKDYRKAYDDKVLFDGVDLHLSHGDRVGLLGANGTGKSSLFRDIVADGAWDHEVIRLGPRVKLGYYAQEHDTLDPERTLLDHIRRQCDLSRDGGFRLLSRFLFTWLDMDRTIDTLSGGEKSRVQLAGLVGSGVNFLLLDEPTNHLDIPSCERVEEALENFEGTLLVISHDRYFLDRVVDNIVEIDSGQLRQYPGNFTDFWRQKQRSAVAANGKAVRKATPARSKGRKTTAPDTGELLRDIERREAEKTELEADLAKAYKRQDAKKSDKIGRRLKDLEADIAGLYAAWEQQEG